MALVLAPTHSAAFCLFGEPLSGLMAALRAVGSKSKTNGKPRHRVPFFHQGFSSFVGTKLLNHWLFAEILFFAERDLSNLCGQVNFN
jgi:hypothetical protein